MKTCYKCQKSYLEPNGPGFQDVCEGCQSYLHCCQNCHFYDPYQHNNCTEPQAEYVSDANGMNRCEYFRFKLSKGGNNFDSRDGGRRFRKPDWRNVNKDQGKRDGSRQRRGAGSLFRGGGGRGSRDDRSQKAREALDKLFKKE